MELPADNAQLIGEQEVPEFRDVVHQTGPGNRFVLQRVSLAFADLQQRLADASLLVCFFLFSPSGGAGEV